MTLCSGYVQVCNTFSFIFIKLAFPDPTRKWKNYNQSFFFSKYQVNLANLNLFSSLTVAFAVFILVKLLAYQMLV